MDALSVVRFFFASASFLTVHIFSYIIMFSSSALLFLDTTAISSIFISIIGVVVICLTVTTLFVFMLSTESPSKSMRIDRERGKEILSLIEYERKHRSRTGFAVLITASLPICGFIFKSPLGFFVFAFPMFMFCIAYLLTLFWNLTNRVSYPRQNVLARLKKIFAKRKRFVLNFISKDFGQWASVRLFVLISALAASSGIALYISVRENVDLIQYGDKIISGSIIFRSNSGIALITKDECLFVYEEGLVVEFTICKAN